MLSKRFASGIAAIALLGLVAGCATPKARIRRHPEMFAEFSPEVQERVRQGGTALGDSKDMVYIALGRPARIYTRETADGKHEIWSYVRVYPVYDERWRQDRLIVLRNRNGTRRYVRVTDTSSPYYRREHEYEWRRLEFADGRVVAIEEVEL